jgi:hypothetical protein
MPSKPKLSITLPVTTPRNPLVVPTLKKKAGKHVATPGGERKRANDEARLEGRAPSKTKG